MTTIAFVICCKIVLLKYEGYIAKEIASILNTNNMSVHNWINRFLLDGICGLRTKAGQERKPILEEEHLSIVKKPLKKKSNGYHKLVKLLRII